MKHRLNFSLAMLLGLFLGLGIIHDADAKRLGGGASFGSKSTYNTPYKRSTAPQQPSAAQQRNSAQRDALAKRGGLMGLLGGLALGGLLGALFFGGAFENLNFMDLLVFGGIAFLLYKLFASRARSAMAQARAGQGNPGSPRGGDAGFDRAGTPVGAAGAQRTFDTDLLFKSGSSSTRPKDSSAAGSPAEAIPQDFDSAAFLAGAKAAYRQLQEAWDRGDLADIRHLTSDAVFAEVQDQLRKREGENQTELLTIEAELLEVRRVGSEMEAAVLFDVSLRERSAGSTIDERPHQAQEVWHFTRPVDSPRPTWLLDGIQQLEA